MAMPRPRLLALTLIALTALASAGCRGGGGILSAPVAQMHRILAQPYEWDSELPEPDWERQVAALPVPDRPLHVVTSIPEVAVVAKYIGRTHLASLYSVMPPPRPEVVEPPAPDVDPAEEARKTVQESAGQETQLIGRNYQTFDITKEPADPVAEGQTPAADRKTQALERMRTADLILLAGQGVDPWMQPLIEESGTQAAVIDLSERMNILYTQYPKAEEGGRNGVAYRTEANHFWWLNLRPTSLAVDSLDMVFSHMVPSGKADITKWRESWLEQLSQLDSAMASILLDDPKMDANTVIPRRVLLDSPALAWFVKRFDMQIVDIINTDFDQQPSPERIDEIVKKSKEKYVSIIICTSGYRTPAVDEIAKQLSIEIWDEGTKARMTVPVPVVEVPIGLGGGGQSTEDFIPLHLFVAQTVARAYKPIIDGLFRLKQEIEKQQKATTDAPADGEAEGEGEAAPPAEGTPPPAEGAPPPAGGTPPTAGGQ